VVSLPCSLGKRVANGVDVGEELEVAARLLLAASTDGGDAMTGICDGASLW